jgi:hypothetical protein
MIEGVPIVINNGKNERANYNFRVEDERKNLVPNRMVFKGYKNEKDRIQVKLVYFLNILIGEH